MLGSKERFQLDDPASALLHQTADDGELQFKLKNCDSKLLTNFQPFILEAKKSTREGNHTTRRILGMRDHHNDRIKIKKIFQEKHYRLYKNIVDKEPKLANSYKKPDTYVGMYKMFLEKGIKCINPVEVTNISYII